MILWEAGIDESGFSGRDTYAIVSAALGRRGNWEEVIPNWRKILKNYNVDHFHATEFNCGEGVAKHLKNWQRVECVKELISAVHGRGFEYQSFVLEHELFRKQMRHFPKRNLTIYDYLVCTTISSLTLCLSAYQSLEKEEMKALVTVEQKHRISPELLAELMKAALEGKLRPIEEIKLGEKKDIPCNVADMLAYDTMKTVHSSIIDQSNQDIRVPESELRPSFEKIIEGNVFRPFVISEDWLNIDLPEIFKFLDRTKGPKQ